MWQGKEKHNKTQGSNFIWKIVLGCLEFHLRRIVSYYSQIVNSIEYCSSPPSLPSSQPPTRETSPSPQHVAALNNARTPPPKRWKRSFDMTHHPGQHPGINKEQPLPLVSEDILLNIFSVYNI